MKHTTLTKVLATITLGLAAGATLGHAQILTSTESQVTGGSYGPGVSLPAANLTTLGTTDWAIFGSDGSEVTVYNSKSGGGSNIGTPSYNFVNNNYMYQGAPGQFGGGANANFSYTNGVSPTSESGLTNIGATAGAGGASFLNLAMEYDMAVQLEAGTDTLTLFLGGYQGSGGTIYAASNSPAFSSSVGFSGNYNGSYADVETLTFSGVTQTQVVGLDFTSYAGGDSSQFAVFGAALSVDAPVETPEPSTYALLLAGVAALFVVSRRTRRTV